MKNGDTHHAVSRAGAAAAGAALALALMTLPFPAYPAENLNLLLTSNLEGKFNHDAKDQEKTDPLILLGQSLIAEAANGRFLYFDLGNAFYPGTLSKYSYGAAVMDFLTSFGCRATLISSMDLRIGVSSLEFLHSRGETILLSANILKDKDPLFMPYTVHRVGKRDVAFIGLSSKKILFDVAEKNVYKIGIDDEIKIMERLTAELKNKGVNDIILLSGLGFKDNMTLLNRFPGIGLIITGGDNKGRLIGGGMVRLETADRRSIIAVPPGRGYCLLSLSVDDRISVNSIRFKQPAHHAVSDDRYDDFIERISTWKAQFAEETKTELAATARPVLMDQMRIAHLLQDDFNAEVSIVMNEAVTPATLTGSIRTADILSAINHNYLIYTFRLGGDDIQTAIGGLKNCTVSGYRDKKIQGYDVESKRTYRVVTAQNVYERICGILKKKVAYKNSWRSIPDIITDDLKGARIVLREDFRYLDRRFHFTFDALVSGSYDASRVFADNSASIPVGESTASNTQWSVEGTFNFTVYNQYHKMVLTPYINYGRQNNQYLNNLLKGTQFYSLNVNPLVNPYNKLQFETVVMPVRGDTMPDSITTASQFQQYRNYLRMLRPVTMRETIGMNITSPLVTCTIGAGFEKKIHDPVKPPVFGIEADLAFTYDFLGRMNYSLKWNSFLSLLRVRGAKDNDSFYFRSEMENALTFKLTDMLGFSLKYRWYYRQNLHNNRRYSNSQIVTSCDLKTNFKI